MKSEVCFEFRCRRCNTDNVHLTRGEWLGAIPVPERLVCTACNLHVDIGSAQSFRFSVSRDCVDCGRTNVVPAGQATISYNRATSNRELRVSGALPCALCGSGGEVKG